MRIHRTRSAGAASTAAAAILAQTVRATPDSVLGLATGHTMIALYARLLAAGVPLHRATTFNLDEYVGLAPTDPRSFHASMHRLLFAPAGMRPDRTFLPDGLCADRAEAAFRYEAAIARHGGIAVQLLGIGRNGHLGFNEPGSDPASRTRDVALSPETRAQNAPDFGGDPRHVPPHAITVGLGTILEARRIVLLATGPAKARAIARLLRDPPAPSLPASCLHKHASVDLVLDADAATQLEDDEIPNPPATL